MFKITEDRDENVKYMIPFFSDDIYTLVFLLYFQALLP